MIRRLDRPVIRKRLLASIALAMFGFAAMLLFAGRTVAQDKAWQGNTWQINVPESQIMFSVRHMTIINIVGGFSKFDGSVTYDPNDLSHTSIQVNIGTASVFSGIEGRDKDLRSPNYLDVEKYPTMTFQSKRAEVVGPGKLKITGDLSLHGVTKEVVLDVTGPTAEVKDAKGTHVGAQATTTIRRKDFGITFGRVLDNGGLAVGDEVAINLQIEMIQPAPPAAPAR